MPHNRHSQRLFYALTAILLLMQSFAVWHDAEHEFHANVEQCERLEAFTHVPSLDIINLTTVSLSLKYSVTEDFYIETLLRKKHRDADAIRAPPTFS